MLLGMILPEHLSVMETRPLSSCGKNGISRERVRPKNTQAGFSLVEMIVVLALILIIVAVSIPTITQTIYNYRLDAAGHAVASLLQQARIQAVKSNTPYYAQFNTATTPNMVYANASTGAFTSGTDSDVTIANDISFLDPGTIDHKQLDDTLSSGNSSAISNIGGLIGFNARGLPCTEQSSTPAICIQSGNAANYFEWFMQSKSNGGWEAVTVTPAGRIKAWRLVSTNGGCGKDSSGTAYQGCWQ
jgi:prepilin-type N-terminal cleavage/methylation domain-containing protein